MNWSLWIRQLHRWLSIAFTLAVLLNIVLLIAQHYPPWVGFLALAPLWLLLFSGLFLFALPYFRKAPQSPADS